MNSFIKTAQYVAAQLTKHYGRQWVNPNQDAVTKPPPVLKRQKQSDANGLSLPQSFTNSVDFVPIEVGRESEKELLFNKRDLQTNAEVEKAVSEPMTPEE